MAVSLSSNDTQVFLYSYVFAKRSSSIMLRHYEQVLCTSLFQDCDVQTLKSNHRQAESKTHILRLLTICTKISEILDPRKPLFVK